MSALKRAWARRRQEVISRDSRRCTRCGAAGRLEVHHVVPGASLRQDFKLGKIAGVEQLVSLCFECHRAEHPRPQDPERLKWQRLVRELL